MFPSPALAVAPAFSRPRSVDRCPPWTLSGAQLVEQADRMLASIASVVAVVTVDHGQAGAHLAGEVEVEKVCLRSQILRRAHSRRGGRPRRAGRHPRAG